MPSPSRFFAWHHFFADLLLILAGFHAIAALVDRFYLRDAIVDRMSLRRTVRPTG